MILESGNLINIDVTDSIYLRLVYMDCDGMLSFLSGFPSNLKRMDLIDIYLKKKTDYSKVPKDKRHFIEKTPSLAKILHAYAYLLPMTMGKSHIDISDIQCQTVLILTMLESYIASRTISILQIDNDSGGYAIQFFFNDEDIKCIKNRKELIKNVKRHFSNLISLVDKADLNDDHPNFIFSFIEYIFVEMERGLDLCMKHLLD